MKSKWRIVVVGALLLTAGVVFLGPLMFAPAVSDAPAVADNAPGFERSVQVEDGTLVLPSVAGSTAMVQFTISNTGKRDTVNVTEVAVEDTSAARMFEMVGPDRRSVTNVPIQPGETVRFGVGSERTVITDYNNDVVPGATLQMKLTFSDSTSITVPLKVESAIGANGTVIPNGAPAPEQPN